MSHVEIEINEIQVEVEPSESVDVVVDSTDVIIVTAQNIGPPGLKGDTGDTGPMDPGLPDHVDSELPHPIYDDGTSFLLRYENQKV